LTPNRRLGARRVSTKDKGAREVLARWHDTGRTRTARSRGGPGGVLSAKDPTDDPAELHMLF
jgi:hypothetical protein